MNSNTAKSDTLATPAHDPTVNEKSVELSDAQLDVAAGGFGGDIGGAAVPVNPLVGIKSHFVGPEL